MSRSTSSSALAHARQKFAAGKSTDALTLLSEALQADPANQDLLYARAHTYISLGNFPAAAQDLDNLLALYPQDASALDDRGVLYQIEGNYLKAAEHHMQAVDLAPSEGTIMNLAIALNYLEQYGEAEKLYNIVLQINPANTRAMTNLAVLFDKRGQYDKAEDYLKEAVNHGEDNFELAMAYGNICRKLERKEEALSWYEKALGKNSQNAQAKFMVALMRGENPEAPPQEHVADLFDSYADNFEDSLVGQLKYRTPELLFEVCKSELEKLKQHHPNATGIDLGAGTGLFGKVLRPYLKTSIGLDLSIKMLQKAQEQNIYDEILCTDMLEGLQQYEKDYFDIIAATDVFVYIGKLDELFQEAQRTLKKDGLFLFSTEALMPEETGNYIARDTARYAHNEIYLKELAAKNGFTTLHFDRTWIRYNKEKPLDGFIVILKKI